MKLKRFKTDFRLWVIVSLVLFALPWWFGFEIGKQGSNPVHPAQLFVILFDGSLNQSAVVAGIAVCALIFGITAVIAGWLTQCLIVIARNALGRKTGNPI